MSEHAQPALSPADSPAVSVSKTDSNVPLLQRIPWTATWILLLSIAAVLNALLAWATHGSIGLFLPLLATCACMLAALFDGYTQRIPNPLTYTCILLGLGLNGLGTLFDYWHMQAGITWLGATGFAPAFAGFGLCAVLGLIGTVFGTVHGGDLKLFAALGAMAGFPNIANIALLALAVALVYAVVNLALVGRLTLVLRIAAHRMLELLYLRRFETPIPEGSKITHIPMAIPLAIATAVVTWLQATHVLSGGSP